MKKFMTILSLMLALCATWSCDYDDSAIWDKVEDLDGRLGKMEEAVKKTNSDLEALSKIVDAFKNSVTINEVIATDNGYTIKFSDGTDAAISNGANGRDGADAPAISVVKGDDGVWYWALDGNIIEVDGKPLKAEGNDGKDGSDGADAITPQVRINETTKEWEISVDGGESWESTGVVAEGKNGDSIFSGVDDKDDEVIFTLADGITTITIPKTQKSNFIFAFPENLPMGSADGTVGVDKYYLFAFGEEKTIYFSGNVTAVDVMSVPQGWSAEVDFDSETVTVKAPAFSGTYYQDGILSLIGIDTNGETVLTSTRVCAVDYSDPEGVFVLNEGNMSSDNGSVIYITADGHVINYAYWRMNGTELGNSAQDMFIAGDKIYIVSQNGGNDGVLVEADARTLKSTAKFSKADLPGLSWSTHVAVVGRTVYLRDNAGVYSLNLDTRGLTFVEGTKGALKNRMAVAGGKVFVPASKSVLVLENGALVETIAMDGAVTGVIKTNDGNLWVSCSTSPAQIIKLNAADYTMDKHTLDAGKVGAGWGSAPGISAKGDEIYYTGNTSTIYRHNFATNITETLGDVKSQVTNWGMIYGAPAVHPVTGEYYYTPIKGYGWSFLVNDIAVFNVAAETPELVADYQNYTRFPAGIFFSSNFQ